MLDRDSTDPLAYKVAGLRALEGQNIVYEVVLDGCSHWDDLEQAEVMRMIDHSDILQSNDIGCTVQCVSQKIYSVRQ